MFSHLLMFVENCIGKGFLFLFVGTSLGFAAALLYNGPWRLGEHVASRMGRELRRMHCNTTSHPVPQQYSDARGFWKSLSTGDAPQWQYNRFLFGDTAIKQGPNSAGTVAQVVIDSTDAMDDLLRYLVTAMFNAIYNLSENGLFYSLKDKELKDSRRWLSILLRSALFLWYYGRLCPPLQTGWASEHPKLPNCKE